MRRQIAGKKHGFKDLDTSGQIPTGFYCSEEFKSITSSEAALKRSFSFVDLTNPHKLNLHMRSYVDYYGGYAEHGRNIIFGLDKTGNYNIKLTPIKTPVDIDPIVWNKLNWFTKNPNFKMKDSIFLTIAGPGWLQKKYLSECRINIGWTMIESLYAHPDVINWLNNCDYVLCPTDIDIKRFKNVNIEKIKMHLGFDNNFYKPGITPLDITNLRGRYVFGVLGSWNKRKNVKAIVQAFVKAFKPEDNVSLLMCCKYGTRPYGEEKNNLDRWNIKYEFEQYLNEIGKTIEECPHITLLDIPIHESLMPHLMARFDSLVGFSMGESTWLPGLQAMAMGIPIIQLSADTNGCEEYLCNVGFLCNKVNYVEADEEMVEGTSEYYKGQKFAEGNVDELAGKMEYVYSNRNCRTVKVKEGLKKAIDWTWEKTITDLDKFIGRL